MQGSDHKNGLRNTGRARKDRGHTVMVFSEKACKWWKKWEFFKIASENAL